jgi:hypothetical protein
VFLVVVISQHGPQTVDKGSEGVPGLGDEG